MRFATSDHHLTALPVTDWIVLSDRAELDPATPDRSDLGLFVLEFALPIVQPTVLLQLNSDGAAPRVFAIFFDPEVGISVLLRRGSEVKRHVLPGPLGQRQGTARLSLAYDTKADSWTLTYLVLGEGICKASSGTSAIPLSANDLHQLCTGGPGSQRHAAVLWFGLTQRSALPARAPWIGLNTPIDTKRGPVKAGLLRRGDLIATLEDGFQPLIGTMRRNFPGRGSFAPVVLRSPFFGLTSDILVSSDQLVLIAGASVEYLFGVEEALISAGALCDGKVAVKD